MSFVVCNKHLRCLSQGGYLCLVALVELVGIEDILCVLNWLLEHRMASLEEVLFDIVKVNSVLLLEHNSVHQVSNLFVFGWWLSCFVL